MKIKSVAKCALLALVLLNGLYLHANRDTAEYKTAYNIVKGIK